MVGGYRSRLFKNERKMPQEKNQPPFKEMAKILYK